MGRPIARNQAIARITPVVVSAIVFMRIVSIEAEVQRQTTFAGNMGQAVGLKIGGAMLGMAYLPPHISQLARFSRNGSRRSAEDDASRRCRNDHECVWKGDDAQWSARLDLYQ
jgi:hypothetical protein